MKIKTSVNPKGQIYIPTKIREAVGMELNNYNDVVLIGNAKALFIIPVGLKAKDALKSLEVIAKHLEHEEEMENE